MKRSVVNDCWAEVSEARINTIARETGLVRRVARKVSAMGLLKCLCAMAVCGDLSCRDVAMSLGLTTGKVPSRQAVWKRLKGHGRAFFEAVLASVLAIRGPRVDASGALRHFGRVLVQDSSVVKLPQKLHQYFSGVANGAASSCQVRVQAVYDLLAENFVAFRMDAYSRNDLCAAGDVLGDIRPGDLLIRDMGYFVIDIFAAIAERGAYFLTRLKPGVQILDPETGAHIDLLALLKEKQRVDCAVLLGAKAKLPVRLVAEPVPQEVGDERRRKRRAENKRINYSAQTLALMDWSIYVTNIPTDWATAKLLLDIYSLRWRIECIFKAWKSHLCFTEFTNMTLNKLYITMAARLITVTLMQRKLSPPFTSHAGCPGNVPVRPDLSLQLLSKLSRILAAATAAGGAQPSDEALTEIIQRLCVYDKRKRQNYPQLLRRLLTAPPEEPIPGLS